MSHGRGEEENHGLKSQGEGAQRRAGTAGSGRAWSKSCPSTAILVWGLPKNVPPQSGDHSMGRPQIGLPLPWVTLNLCVDFPSSKVLYSPICEVLNVLPHKTGLSNQSP